MGHGKLSNICRYAYIQDCGPSGRDMTRETALRMFLGCHLLFNALATCRERRAKRCDTRSQKKECGTTPIWAAAGLGSGAEIRNLEQIVPEPPSFSQWPRLRSRARLKLHYDGPRFLT